MLAVYVSGHGFGHATRTAEVLRELRARSPRLPIVVVTSAPAFLFDEVAPPRAVRPLTTGVGLAQHDALVIDLPGTLRAWRSFMAGWEGLVEQEALWLRREGARLVLADIPPLAFAAASRAGVPAIGLGNFSWDWIYRHLARTEPALAEAAFRAAEAYGKAALLLRLPFAGDLSAFPAIRDVPLVARVPRVSKAEARRRLGLDERPAVLLSFGGVGLPGLDLAAVGRLTAYRIVLTDIGGADRGGTARGNLSAVDSKRLGALGLGYPDLVGACDVVVTKPGYGIVSDCVGARTRLVYTERGDFPEYPVMVAEMGRYLPAVHVPNRELREGRLEAALERVLALSFPQPPALDGASAAADALQRAL